MTTTRSSEVDTSFDRYARMVRRALGVPVALVSLVESDRQVFPGAVGLPAPYQSTRETPLSHSFCQYVVADRAPLVVTDARLDDRLRDNLAIPDLGVVAYAGWPITDHTGAVVGSLCAIDDRPRTWQQDELDSLADLAAACSTELAQRRLRDEAVAGQRNAQDLARRSRVLLALSEGLSRTQTLADVAAAVEQVSLDQLDCLRAGLWLHDDSRPVTADLPAAGRGTAPAATASLLRYVEPVPPGSAWESATRHAALPADGTNPVGLALRQGGPVFFSSAAAQNARWPHLGTDAQIGEARMFLPLVVRRRQIGTLVLVWAEQREFSDGDLATYRAIAAYAGQAVVRARLHQERTEALVTLQSAMLPRLPQPDDLELAARYRPSAQHQVGGDWYDAVVMPDGVTALMIGDVVGHDIAAAAVMGQLRTMLRAIAWAVDDAPSLNVSRLDRAVRDLDVDAMATLVYARVEQEPDGRRLVRWTNAGHPPPLLVEPDGSTRWLESAPDLMLGVLPTAPRSDHRTHVGPGSTLLLYTDGLVERRGEDLRLGLDRLAGAAARHAHEPVATFLDRLLGELGADHASDDVAVLAVRFGD